MKVRWQLSAVSDLTDIHDFIAENNPDAARSVTERVLGAVDRLETFPASGRLGRAPGTREVVVPGLPYVIVYSYDNVGVDVLSVFHGARDR